MKLIPILMKELEQEAQTTRKMLSCVPDDKFDWKPHEKSMSVRSLTTHIAELPTWLPMTMNTDELDFAKNAYSPKAISSRKELLNYFEESFAAGKEALRKIEDEAMLLELWTLRNGETIYSTRARHEVIRMTFSQITHHRAQLGVFLRLLNIPIPGSYGPSADEGFKKTK